VALLLTFDFWFRPKRFESERLYAQLGALVIKRYVPTGGDLVMQRLRRRSPGSRWVKPNVQSLCGFERRTRLNESVHLIGFAGGTVWAAYKFASGSLSLMNLSMALVLACVFGLWPVTLQRYNRIRLFRAIHACERRRQR
jgi:glycosyl-4,4'-diaponeurosporenoate acyltransferase